MHPAHLIRQLCPRRCNSGGEVNVGAQALVDEPVHGRPGATALWGGEGRDSGRSAREEARRRLGSADAPNSYYLTRQDYHETRKACLALARKRQTNEHSRSCRTRTRWLGALQQPPLPASDVPQVCASASSWRHEQHQAQTRVRTCSLLGTPVQSG